MNWKKLYEEELKKIEVLESRYNQALHDFTMASTITQKQNADKILGQIGIDKKVACKNADIFYRRALEAGQIEESKEVIEEPKIEETVDEPESSSITAEEVFTTLAALIGGAQEADDAHDEKNDI